MAENNAVERRRMAIENVKLIAATARLPATIPTERRNPDAREALVRRIIGEFVEMPGLCLTSVQASRLFGIHRDVSARILEQLCHSEMLYVTTAGQYVVRPRPS